MDNKVTTSKENKKELKNMINLEKPGHQVLVSYAAVCEIQKFLDPLEFTKMQLLCTYFYKTGVGRAQTTIALPCILRTGGYGFLRIHDDKHLIRAN